jgi:hypothetical protein
MGTTRRSLFQFCAAFFATRFSGNAKAALAVKPTEVKDLTLFNRILRECESGKVCQFGGWKIMWTGWKSSAHSIDKYAQWVAFPLSKNGRFHPKRLPIFVSTPGYSGEFRRGEAFNNAMHWPQVSMYDLMQSDNTPEEMERIREAERTVCLRLLLEWMQAGGEPKWERMSKETRFYTCPDRYVLEATGERLFHPCTNHVPSKAATFAFQCREHLLGFGKSQNAWWYT